MKVKMCCECAHAVNFAPGSPCSDCSEVGKGDVSRWVADYPALPGLAEDLASINAKLDRIVAMLEAKP